MYTVVQILTAFKNFRFYTILRRFNLGVNIKIQICITVKAYKKTSPNKSLSVVQTIRFKTQQMLWFIPNFSLYN